MKHVRQSKKDSNSLKMPCACSSTDGSGGEHHGANTDTEDWSDPRVDHVSAQRVGDGVAAGGCGTILVRYSAVIVSSGFCQWIMKFLGTLKAIFLLNGIILGALVDTGRVSSRSRASAAGTGRP